MLDSSPNEVDAAFLDCVIGIASGRKTVSEQRGLHAIAIWKRDVTL